MKSKLALVVLLIFGVSSLFAQDEDTKKEEIGYKFTEVKTIPVTSVKNQYRSGTCWSFSGLAFIEAEMLRKGKEDVDLSEMFVVHHSYYDKSLKYVRMHGTINYGGGGAFNDVIDVMRNYGMVPEEVYTGLQYDEPKHVHGEMDNLLDAMVNSIIKNKNKKLTKVWPKAIDGVLDAYLGPIPENFDYKGKNYTPKTFLTDYMDINPDDYIMLTSYSHHPFYKSFAIEVQDNWAYGQVYNLPLDEFMQVIDANIDGGYTIAWAADVSENGFSWKNGVAIVPEEEIKSMNDLEQSKWEKLSKKELKKLLYSFDEPHTEKKITQEIRQAAFDNYETTDDHGMLIMGTAKDQNGTLYYKIKNSWGTDQKYDGYFYASKAFVEYKTMSILINKEAIPKSLLKKLNLK
jgi:bleomycin hydrolase